MSEERVAERDRPPAPTAPDISTFSNALHLSGREWIGVGLFALALVIVAPSLWKQTETFAPEVDYRVPYDLSSDYWFYDRYSRLAASRYDTLLVGDSVIWGQYVKREGTLSHFLNERAGEERFANLGLDGVHPTALAGLLEYYAGGISGKKVLLQCNPLWMSSTKHDLQEEEASPFNHPALVPQFFPWLPSYKEDPSKRIGNVVARYVPFSGWTSHLQQAYFERMSIPAWTLEHPYEDPLGQLAEALPPSDNILRHEPVSWTERGIKRQSFSWVKPEASIQWHSFQRAVEILKRKGNRVFVLVGPFNEHMLNNASLREYREVKRVIETWLREKKVAYAVPAALPSEDYADASHPLSPGYALLARRLFDNAFFRTP